MSWLALALLVAQAPDGREGTTSPPPKAAAESPALALLREGHALIEQKANTKANLLGGLAAYEKALAEPSLTKRQRIDAYVDRSRAYLRLGDMAKGSAALDQYERGREAAQQALALDEQHAEALFWDTANLASIGRTRGVRSSLFLVPELKKGFERVLALDPDHGYARETLAKIYHKLPGLMGGDDDKCEALLRENLARDPRFTSTMVVLAQLYIDQKRYAEARALLRKVKDMPSREASIPHDHWRFNVPDAKRLLASIEGK